jgi:hypothetical protein
MLMSVEQFKQQVDRQIDLYGMAQFSRGFEACIEALEELSNQKHNEGLKETAEVLRWAARELLGENA